MKGNREMECLRCGACCHVDMVAYVLPEDIRRWEEGGRYDIISRLQKNEVMWAGDRIVNRFGVKVTTCVYLALVGSSFACEIYDTRPVICRSYIPGSSELCPQFYREKNIE